MYNDLRFRFFFVFFLYSPFVLSIPILFVISLKPFPSPSLYYSVASQCCQRYLLAQALWGVWEFLYNNRSMTSHQWVNECVCMFHCIYVCALLVCMFVITFQYTFVCIGQILSFLILPLSLSITLSLCISGILF